MIDTNILNILKSLDDFNADPSYSVIIKNFHQPTSCNKEQLQVTVQQINPSLFKIISNQKNYINTLEELLTTNNITIPNTSYELSINNIVEKTLNIESVLNFDSTTAMFKSGLTGNIINETNKEIPELDNIVKDISNRHIENVTFPLQASVEIDFLYQYQSLPSVILTIDQANKLYSSYTLDFKTDTNNNYTGVTINFVNLKRKKNYGDINVLVIGDEVDETNEN